MISSVLMTHIIGAFQVSPDGLPTAGANTSTLQTILNIVFGVVGGIAVLIIVIAGFRYITGSGNPTATAQARNAIIYSAVGIAVTLAAYAIVTFVINGIG